MSFSLDVKIRAKNKTYTISEFFKVNISDHREIGKVKSDI